MSLKFLSKSLMNIEIPLINKMSKIIFGPAPSRRLGRSLGINLVNLKTCNMDCIYCELGKSKSTVSKRMEYIKADAILNEFLKIYPKIENEVDTITLTGAGEPTLNSSLGEIFRAIKQIVGERKKIAILTNSTGFADKNIYNALLNFDIVVPSLDSCLEESFQAVNNPDKSVKLKDIISNLQSFSKEFKGELLIEVLFCKNVNDSFADISALINCLKGMENFKLQLGSIDRPPAYSNAERVSDDFLLTTLSKLLEEGINAEIIGGFNELRRNIKGDLGKDYLKEIILSLLGMRPCSLAEMSAVFLQKQENIKAALSTLLNEGKVEEIQFSNKTYFKIKGSSQF